MRTFLKILGVGAALVLTLVVVAAIALWTIDVDTFRAPLARYVKDATGRDLAIKGSLKLELSLEPRLVVNDVALSNASWAQAPEMMSIKRLEARFALFPLLRRRFEVSHFDLVEPIIALETDAKGRGNWELAAGEGEPGARPGAPSGKPPAGDAATPDAGAAPGRANMAALAVADVSIAAGGLTFLDGRTGRTTRISIERLVLHADNAQSPVTASFRGAIDGIPIALDGVLGPVDALRAGQWPYPVALQGEVDGSKGSLSAKYSRFEGASELSDIEVALGGTRLHGSVRVTEKAGRSRFTAKLAAPSLAGRDFDTLAVLSGGKPEPKSAPDTAHIFSPQPFELGALSKFDADADLSVDALELGDGRRVEQLHVKFALDRGVLRTSALEGRLLGGSLRGTVTLDTRGEAARIDAAIDLREIDLAQALAALQVPREVRGGKANVDAALAMSGDSLRQWASSATGNVRVVVGKATLMQPRPGTQSPLLELGAAFNPLQSIRDATELDCAVVRLPLSHGVARIDRSIGIETRDLSVSASGTVDLRNETLDLSIAPRLRQGVSIDIAQIAQLVRVRGPLRKPAITIDAVATAATAARVGVGLATSGVSILAESLLPSVGNQTSANACRAALGGNSAGVQEAAAKPASSARDAATNPLDALSKALGNAFRR